MVLVVASSSRVIFSERTAKMKRELYYELLDRLRNTMKARSSRNELKSIAQLYEGVTEETLGSIYSQDYQRRMKKLHHKHYQTENVRKYYDRYQAMIKNGHKQVLLILADQIDLSPALLARLIVEQHLRITSQEEDPPQKTVITKLLKDPALIEDATLAQEVQYSLVADENYGPLVDTIKHSVGHEYEFMLKQMLEARGLPFLGEDQMRLKGYDKTPDVKLEIPIAVNGHVVNWIESKASFGDDESHNGYLKDQFWSYWNRFGPGLVIYWFGFIDDLDVHQEKGIQLMDHFPTDIVKMDPASIS